MDGNIRLYNWIETMKMIVDILTKEKAISNKFEDFASKNIYGGLGESRNLYDFQWDRDKND